MKKCQSTWDKQYNKIKLENKNFKIQNYEIQCLNQRKNRRNRKV